MGSPGQDDSLPDSFLVSFPSPLPSSSAVADSDPFTELVLQLAFGRKVVVLKLSSVELSSCYFKI